MQWEENTKGLDKILNNIEKLVSKEVKVGFFDDRYSDDNENLYVAQVAQWQEEGHKAGKEFAPPRPFFRMEFASRVTSDKYKRPMDKMLCEVADGNLTPHAACKKLGTGLVFELQDIIEHGDMFKANSPRWADEKRKYMGAYLPPLNFTGKMQESVKFKIVNKGRSE